MEVKKKIFLGIVVNLILFVFIFLNYSNGNDELVDLLIFSFIVCCLYIYCQLRKVNKSDLLEREPFSSLDEFSDCENIFKHLNFYNVSNDLQDNEEYYIEDVDDEYYIEDIESEEEAEDDYYIEDIEDEYYIEDVEEEIEDEYYIEDIE